MSQTEDKPKVGRPTIYSKKLSARLCAELSKGISLRTVCLSKEMPGESTVFEWLQDNIIFAEQYARAKQESSDAMAEQIVDIADNGTNDWMEVRKGKDTIILLDREHVERSKLRIESRKWLMAKMKPKKYGNSLDVTSGHEKLPVPILDVSIYNSDKKGHEYAGADQGNPRRDVSIENGLSPSILDSLGSVGQDTDIN